VPRHVDDALSWCRQAGSVCTYVRRGERLLEEAAGGDRGIGFLGITVTWVVVAVSFFRLVRCFLEGFAFYMGVLAAVYVANRLYATVAPPVFGRRFLPVRDDPQSIVRSVEVQDEPFDTPVRRSQPRRSCRRDQR